MKVKTFFLMVGLAISGVIASESFFPAYAATLSYEYNGEFTAGTLIGRKFSGNYSYDDKSNQITSFNQTFEGLNTTFTLKNFSTVVVSSFDTFSLNSPSLEVSFIPTNSRSYNVKWYDWSDWDDADRIIVPETGDTRGLAHIEQVPEPLTILGSLTALGIGIALKKKQKQIA